MLSRADLRKAPQPASGRSLAGAGGRVSYGFVNVDDRAREIATLFAFGVRPRMVLWLQMGEDLLLGVLGAALGLAAGIPLLRGFMAVRMEDMLEEIGLVVTVAPATLVAIVALTAGVVALTPLVLARRLRRIDVPSTLRVME